MVVVMVMVTMMVKVIRSATGSCKLDNFLEYPFPCP